MPNESEKPDPPGFLHDDPGIVDSAEASLAALARDPLLIPGVYESCDQWCMYCQITQRCLAFRCTNANEVGAIREPCGAAGEEIGEGLLFALALARAERRLAPPEIEAAVSGDLERQRKVFTLDDPLERLGRSCLTLAEAYLQSRADFPPPIEWQRTGATPLETLTWFHALAPARVFRAILCDREAREGVPERQRDALAAAKVALVGIDRSLTALAALAVGDDDPRLGLLQHRLHHLREAVDARFPGARAYCRPGLDEGGADSPRIRRYLRRLGRLLHWRRERAAGQTQGDVRGSARRAGSPRG